jgi:hypothetical protein
MGSVSATWSSAIATSQKMSLLTLPAPSRAIDSTATAVPRRDCLSSAMMLTLNSLLGIVSIDRVAQFVTASETCRAGRFTKKHRPKNTERIKGADNKEEVSSVSLYFHVSFVVNLNSHLVAARLQ